MRFAYAFHALFYVHETLAVGAPAVLALKSADWSDVLSGLKSAQVVTLFIANSKVTDIEELISDLKPELGGVATTAPELGEDATNSFLALWWMAVIYVAAKAALRTRESTGCRRG